MVLTAAGSGTRLGREVPKALVPVRGTPLVLHAAKGIADSGCVDTLVVTVPQEQAGLFAAALTQCDGALDGLEVRLTFGGATRQASVAAGVMRPAALGRADPRATNRRAPRPRWRPRC